MGYRVYVRTKKTKAGEPGIWNDKKRLEVVTTYLTCINVPLTSAMTGVPVDTINTWKKKDWWKKYVDELQYEDNLQVDQKLTKIMDKALDQVLDRLDNGDVMYDPRTGKVVRVPAKLKDAGKIVNDAIDKKQLIRKTVKEKVQPQQAITSEHLLQLAKAFSEFSTGKKEKEIPNNIYDGEFNALQEIEPQTT